MLKLKEKTESLISSPQEELLEKLVRKDHAFRTLNNVLNFTNLFTPYRSLYSHTGTIGIANVLDFKVLKDISPFQGMVFCDKLYDCREANTLLVS